MLSSSIFTGKFFLLVLRCVPNEAPPSEDISVVASSFERFLLTFLDEVFFTLFPLTTFFAGLAVDFLLTGFFLPSSSSSSSSPSSSSVLPEVVDEPEPDEEFGSESSYQSEYSGVSSVSVQAKAFKNHSCILAIN
jgi:hypothetical protein